MEQPIEASPATQHAPAGAPTPLEKQEKQKKTADMAAYMRAYRLANLEKCREQDRKQYHASKPVTDEDKMKKAQRSVLNALTKYPELLNNI